MAYKAVLALVVMGLFGCMQTIHADAFLDVDGVFTTIIVPGSFPGTTQVTGINNLGQIVGTFDDSSGNLHVFVDTNGGFTVVNIPGGNFEGVRNATGINDMGQIVGYFNNFVGFVYSSGSLTEFFVRGLILEGINDSDEVVGYTLPAFFGEQGFVSANGTDTTLLFPGATDTELYGINNVGQIVGAFSTDGGLLFQPFVYSMGTFTAIPSSSVYISATGINDSGQVVGYFSDVSGVHGFLDTNGAIQIINAPGAVDTYPVGVNNAGEIVGNFALPIPEPASFLLIGFGLAAIIVLKPYRVRRSKRSSAGLTATCGAILLS